MSDKAFHRLARATKHRVALSLDVVGRIARVMERRSSASATPTLARGAPKPASPLTLAQRRWCASFMRGRAAVLKLRCLRGSGLGYDGNLAENTVIKR